MIKEELHQEHLDRLQRVEEHMQSQQDELHRLWKHQHDNDPERILAMK